MKLFSLVLFVCLNLSLQAQSRYKILLGEYNYAYTPENHRAYFALAKKNIGTTDIDSLYKSCIVLLGLSLYDTLLYNEKTLMPLTKEIKQSMHRAYSDKLQGKWKLENVWFEGLGNFDDSRYNKNENYHIEFKEGLIGFYHEGKLISRSKYVIESSPNAGVELLSLMNWRLRFTGEKTVWGISFKKSSTGEQTLEIDREPYCVCGCLYESYQRT